MEEKENVKWIDFLQWHIYREITEFQRWNSRLPSEAEIQEIRKKIKNKYDFT